MVGKMGWSLKVLQSNLRKIWSELIWCVGVVSILNVIIKALKHEGKLQGYGGFGGGGKITNILFSVLNAEGQQDMQ